MIKYRLDKHSDKRGDLYVIEENNEVSLRYKYYYIIRDDHSNIVVKDPMSLLVLKGVVESDKYKVDKGTFISDIYEIGNVSSDFTGLLLSNDRIAELGDAQINPGFEVKRIFFVDNMPVGAIRGQHAHKTEKQYLICLNGLIDIKLTSEKKVISKRLADLEAIYLPPMFWTEIINLKYNSIIPVFASSNYLQEEYITNIEDIY
jgi:dTDP-4-dehydrorhamnose 3,5-epimerase-like enzyme